MMKKIIALLTILTAAISCYKTDTDDSRFIDENLKATMNQINLEISLNGVTQFYIASQLNAILSGEENVYAGMFTEISDDKWYSDLLNIRYETGGRLMNEEGADWKAGHYQTFRFLGENTWLLTYQNGDLNYEINLTLVENSSDIFEVSLSGDGEYTHNNVVTEFEVQDVNVRRQFVDNVLVRTTSTGVIKGDFYDSGEYDEAKASCELHLGSIPVYITESNPTESER